MVYYLINFNYSLNQTKAPMSNRECTPKKDLMKAGIVGQAKRWAKQLKIELYTLYLAYKDKTTPRLSSGYQLNLLARATDRVFEG